MMETAQNEKDKIIDSLNRAIKELKHEEKKQVVIDDQNCLILVLLISKELLFKDNLKHAMN